MKKEKLKRWRNYGVLVLTLALAMAASFKYISSYSTVSSNVNGKELPICSVETKEKKVSLTFDVSWGDKDIDRILDILENEGIRATFFMTGTWVEKYPEAVRRMKEAGHDLANGSESHRSMVEMGEEEQKVEVMRVHERVMEMTGVEMKLFRLPYDNYDDPTIRNVSSCGYFPIQWSVNSLDWKDYGAEHIVDTVLNNRNMKNGAIILLHNETKYTADALYSIIKGIREKGYQMVPVSELIYEKDYHMDVTGRQMKDRAVLRQILQ